ncbi:U4/U6 small nuclear ribonucleoprotein Prp31 [Cichlidogyrus casuarinus]|uniref:U4/U6 small nuclear ribonucleoprotein Prp31 n=1 Tax=Cichlidogyrus casuarinus TaxID=1844966 RepID=A0ABD2Q4R3_9PLAT
MSLAEELLADFEDEMPQEEAAVSIKEEMDTTEAPIMQEVESKLQNLKKTRIIEYATLRNNEKLVSTIKKIDFFNTQPKRDRIIGPVEADPEYMCIVEANNLVAEIDNELGIIHKFIKDIYSKRFPELESLVPTSSEYIKTVQALKNDILENSKDIPKLTTFLTAATMMVLSVTASTTQGSLLSDDDIQRCMEACEMAIELQDIKKSIIAFVESRMSLIAPNLSIILGPSCAAKIIGHAGGLNALSKIPSCNIYVLGSQKKNLAGFSTNQALPHTGYIYNSEYIQKLPPDVRMKASRLVANKVAIAARIDAFHESQDGTHGENLLMDIERKIYKWTEPPPVKNIKPLPVPMDPPAKKRGGRRYRKMKERMGMSDMRRTANRIQFGDINEDAYNDMSYSTGSLGKRSVGDKIRAPTVDSKTKARISKALQQKLNRYGGLSTMPTTALGATTWGAKSTIRDSNLGTASSVSFTPHQGLEIVNPSANEKPKEENKKYFSDLAGFTKTQKVNKVVKAFIFEENISEVIPTIAAGSNIENTTEKIQSAPQPKLIKLPSFSYLNGNQLKSTEDEMESIELSTLSQYLEPLEDLIYEVGMATMKIEAFSLLIMKILTNLIL